MDIPAAHTPSPLPAAAPGRAIREHFELDRWQAIQGESKRWYKWVQTLGAGGNGIAFLAMCSTPPLKGDLVAIKVFRRWSKPERRQAFLEEISFLQACQHPAILRIFDRGEYKLGGGSLETAPFVVAEYLPYTLRTAMRGNRLRMVDKVSFAMQLLSALTYLATLEPQVVHRDIKPENIFIKGGSCVLGDLGLLKRLVATDTVDDKELVKTSIGVGMPFYYRTPDLVAYLNNGTPLTLKTDVFQLGLVLAELFSGRNPLRAPTDFTDPIELGPVGWIDGKYGAGIAAQIRRMLELDPAKRPSAAELIDGWEAIFREVVDATIETEGRAF